MSLNRQINKCACFPLGFSWGISKNYVLQFSFLNKWHYFVFNSISCWLWHTKSRNRLIEFSVKKNEYVPWNTFFFLMLWQKHVSLEEKKLLQIKRVAQVSHSVWIFWNNANEIGWKFGSNCRAIVLRWRTAYRLPTLICLLRFYTQTMTKTYKNPYMDKERKSERVRARWGLSVRTN